MTRLPAAARKRVRRTATAVLSGDFDQLPPRDVLTSVLNSNPYKAVEGSEERKKRRKLLKQETWRGSGKIPDTNPFKMARTSAPNPSFLIGSKDTPPTKNMSNTRKPPVYQHGRPQINIIMPRSMSVTPPPTLESPSSTPEPSNSSSTSHTSSKRPHTPLDDELIDSITSPSPPPPPPLRRPRKRRPAVRKGWKGWVEGSPPPSSKLINLDSAPIIQERRTRNGKPFGPVAESGWD